MVTYNKRLEMLDDFSYRRGTISAYGRADNFDNGKVRMFKRNDGIQNLSGRLTNVKVKNGEEK